MRSTPMILGATLLLVVAAPALADKGLAAAIRAGDLTAVRATLARGADVDALSGRFTPLALAAIRGELDIVNTLLSAGADPNAPSLGSDNPLSMAVRSCHAGPDIIDALIEAGADIENRSSVAITPLMLAIQEKRTDVALRLLDSGADVNTLGPFGDGVLNYAIYVKDPVLIDAALDGGVDTTQLRKLFTTVDYDPPGIGNAKSHHEVLCDPPAQTASLRD